MSIFAIADLHLSLSSDKPMDIFNGWDNYIDKLTKNWCSIVKKDDTVVIAGDISWSMKLENSKKDFEYIDNLPGKKIILKGNHDYWWETKSKIESFLEKNNFNTISVLFNCAYKVENYAICGTRGWFYNAEKDADKKILNREVGRLNRSIDDAEKTGLEPIVFLHYPPVYNCSECTEILDVLLKRNISRCYYGHIHGSNSAKKAVIGNYKGINFHLISSDYLKFMPILIK